MRTYLDCLPCFVRQALDAARLVGAEEALTERVLREVLVAAGRMDYNRPPPEMGQYIHRLVREMTEDPDPEPVYVNGMGPLRRAGGEHDPGSRRAHPGEVAGWSPVIRLDFARS